MWIEEIRIEGGTLDGFRQNLDKHLNVLIGARGTGKSSVIELIRFCLGASSYKESDRQASIEHALGVLGDGKVTVTINDGANRFDVTRTAQDEEPETPFNIDAPFVFSQSEIETIGLQAQSRLRLIDGFLPPETYRKSAENALTSKIKSATAEIRALLLEIDEIDDKTKALPRITAELAEIKLQSAALSGLQQEVVTLRTELGTFVPQVAAARVKEETVARITGRIAEWTSSFDALFHQKPTIEPWPAQAESSDELESLRRQEQRAAITLGAALNQYQTIASELEKRSATTSTLRNVVENKARDIRQKIEERQKGASALDKKIGDLTQQISVLQSLVDLRNARQSRVTLLGTNRKTLVDELLKGREDRTKKRKIVAQRLSKELGPLVRITVNPLCVYHEYISALSAALRGSGLKYGELAERIAALFTPQEVAVLAETRDFATISQTLEITEERSVRLCDSLRADSAGGLITVAVEDDVQIELMDGTDYKGIDFLSMGQRCTTILPIILTHRDHIIVLDQPEDHLDNAFVVGTLIKAILNRAEGAQTIVATHNANIPVLADAKQVIHLDSDGTRCFTRSSGEAVKPSIVDAITTLMEGGREAFQRRTVFYAEHQSTNANF